jgi:hypothetical protein
MRTVSPPPIDPEWLGVQASHHLAEVARVMRAFFPERGPPTQTALAVMECWLVHHPMQRTTAKQAAMCQAARFVAYERLGLSAGDAMIFSQPGPWARYTWEGNARPWPLLDYTQPEEWDAGLVRNEAVAIFAGPIAGELLAERDALNSVGELLAACALVSKATDLGGEAPSDVLRELVVEATALVERCARPIDSIAYKLKQSRLIDNKRPWLIPATLKLVERGPIDTTLLSPAGRALCDKITRALREFEFLCLRAWGRVGGVRQ